MKTRHGFVSNSSSTSFVILGYKIDEKEASKVIRKQFPEEKLLEWLDNVNRDTDSEYKTLEDVIEKEFSYLYYECLDGESDIVKITEQDGFYLGIKMISDEYETHEMVVGTEIDDLKKKYPNIIEGKKLFLICGIEVN